MGDNRSDFREALAELVEATGPEPTDHPSHERWLAYLRGELAEEEAARLQEHLVRCRDCFDLVQAADALFGPGGETAAGGEDPESPEDEVASAAVWRLLHPQLGGKPKAPAARPRRSTGWKFRFPYGIAASLLVALLGMTGWNLEQRREIAVLKAPRPNIQIYDFYAGERTSEPEEKKVTANSVLVFHPGEERRHLTIREAGTKRAIFSRTLQPIRNAGDIGLTCQLPVGLPPGPYLLEIADESGKVLDTYHLRIEPAGRGG